MTHFSKTHFLSKNRRNGVGHTVRSSGKSRGCSLRCIHLQRKITRKCVWPFYLQHLQHLNNVKCERYMYTQGTDVGVTSDSIFYVSEHLGREGKKLLRKATAKKRDAAWNFLWVRNCQMFARKTDVYPVIYKRMLVVTEWALCSEI